jgi:hypothetical protein
MEKSENSIQDFNVVQPGLSHEQKAEALEFWIAKRIGEDLVKTYPGRQWTVNVDTRNESIVINSPSLSKRMGYRINMRRDSIAALLPRTRKAAGEILERFGQSRGPSVDVYSVEDMPRDVRDDVISKDASEKDAVMRFNRAK